GKNSGGNGGGELRGGGGDGFGSEDGSEGRAGKGDAAIFEERTEFFEGAGDALLGGVFAGAEGFANGTQVALLIEAQEDGGTVLGAELVDGVVEDRRELGEVGCGVVGKGVHGDGLPFAVLTAAFAAHEGGGDVAGNTMEPAAEGGIGFKGTGFL